MIQGLATVLIPMIGSLVLIAVFGHETRGRDIRDLESFAQAELIRPEGVPQD